MQVDIYVRERGGSREIRFPWIPEKIQFKSGGTTLASYNILDRGEVVVPTGSGLSTYSWGGLFPGEKRRNSSMQRGPWRFPKYYHSILEDWKKKGTPLHIMVLGYPINADVLLENYEGNMTGGFGDIEYSIAFIEDRDLKITYTEEEPPQRPTDDSSGDGSKTYTIKSGDTLWAIAAMPQHYGDGTKWNKIYEANKDIIESTAKSRGYSSSDNGHWIFPGVKLTIP